MRVFYLFIYFQSSLLRHTTFSSIFMARKNYRALSTWKKHWEIHLPYKGNLTFQDLLHFLLQVEKFRKLEENENYFPGHFYYFIFPNSSNFLIPYCSLLLY